MSSDASEHGAVCETLAVIKIKRRFTNLRRMIERGEVVTPEQEKMELDKIAHLLSCMPPNVSNRVEN